MKRLWLLGLVVVIAAVAVSGVAAAASTGGGLGSFGCFGAGMGAGFRGAVKGGAREPGQALSTMIEKLGLTDEQLGKIREIEAEAFAKMQELRDSMSQKMFELRGLYWQKDPDETAVEALKAEIADLREKMSAIRQQAQDKIKGVLTDEQLDRLTELKESVAGKMRVVVWNKMGARRGGFFRAPATDDAGAGATGTAD